ncbi:glutamate-gated chloride channel subunit beta-like [Procambarus clarkii]|uniref:glutamate-gated chloride channel subunit beta-like n=1 Tax=Procambarus clarkii TaxID=6728 RepID=UPI003744AEED
MTALTAVLVLATLFTQVSSSLPKTSYFKVVDIWLLFCIILVFIIILFHMIIDLQIDYGDGARPNSAKTKKWVSAASGSSLVSVIKVTPAKGAAMDGDAPVSHRSIFSLDLPKMKFDERFLTIVSRYSVLVLFSVFNLVYWGTLAAGSGLVYYY